MANSICHTCRFRRAPHRVTLFSQDDLSNPEVMKVSQEVFEWQRQRGMDEAQRIASLVLFEHPPQNFDWCEGYTREINRYFTTADLEKFRDAFLRSSPKEARDQFDRVVGDGQELRREAKAGDNAAAGRLQAILDDRTDPVSGEVREFFVPAQYINSDRGCDRWERAEE